MAHITIKNIGPIRDVSLDLNKINVFMGPQSSGKSTIAKIISHCSWYEKNTILHPSNRPSFFEEMIAFHNLEETYFNDSSEIQYESDSCKLDFKWKDGAQNRVDFLLKEGMVFQNRKICYIPAERNFVMFQGLGKYNETTDNILSFMYDWLLAKKELTPDNSYHIPLSGLENVSFYYDKDTDADKVVIDSERNIKLNHASSGLRSVIPMLVVFNYIHNSKRAMSPLDYTSSQIIIEKPELNLFPKIQQELIYYMLSILNKEEKAHQLILTTDSPYILFAINNCMMGGLVGSNIPIEEAKTFPSYPSWIDPSDVSIFEIHDGTIRSIQDADGILEDNYLNQAFKENSNEYLSMLNYYDD